MQMKKWHTNDTKSFIQLNGLLSGYKGTRWFLKAVSLSKDNSAYPSHFQNPKRSKIIKLFVMAKLLRMYLAYHILNKKIKTILLLCVIYSLKLSTNFPVRLKAFRR